MSNILDFNTFIKCMSEDVVSGPKGLTLLGLCSDWAANAYARTTLLESWIVLFKTE